MQNNTYSRGLNCRLCKKTLSEDFKTLPCLHNFCFQCLVSNFTEQLERVSRYALPNDFFDDEENVFHCPDCFREVPAAKGETRTVQVKANNTVNRLQSMSFVRNLLKTLKHLNQRQTCERCTPRVRDDPTPPAVAFCKDCEKSYCQTCLDTHRDFCAGHILVDLITSNENIMVSAVSGDADVTESDGLELKNANSSLLEDSKDSFPEVSSIEDKDSNNTCINASKNSKMNEHLSDESTTQSNGSQTKEPVITNLKSCRSKLDAETLDRDQKLNCLSDNPLSVTARSVDMQAENVKTFRSCSAFKNFVFTPKCSIHILPFTAYCLKCEICMCQICWEQHSAESKDCLNIVTLNSAASEKRTRGYALLAEARNYIHHLNKSCLESLKKLQSSAEKCFEEEEEINLDIETIEALQYHLLRQNHLYFKQLAYFITVLRDLLNLATNADLITCFGSIIACWQHLSSKIRNRATFPEIEPAKNKGNFKNLYEKIETLSVTVDQGEPGYSAKTSFQMTRVSMMEKEQTGRRKMVDVATQYSIPAFVIDSTCFGLKKIDYISAIGVSGNWHILLCLYFQSCINEYDSNGQLLRTVKTPGEPSDICAVSDNTFFAVLPPRKKLVILQEKMQARRKTRFGVSKVIDVKRRYVSICKISNFIIACDVYKNVDIIDSDGTIIRCLLKQTEPTKPSAHRLRPGPVKDTFLLLDWLCQTISCYNIEGCMLFCIDTTTKEEKSNGTSDICVGKSGYIYISDCHKIYFMDSPDDQQVLWSFEEELTEEPCIAFTPVGDHLVVSCFSGIDKALVILHIFNPDSEFFF